MAPQTAGRRTQRRERAHRLIDLADTLTESAGEHDRATARLLLHMAEQLQRRADELVPGDELQADVIWRQLNL